MKTFLKSIGLALASLPLVCAIIGCTGCTKPPAPQDKVPVLVTEKEGVKLWKVRSYYNDNAASGYNWVYFTTPNGDVQWREQQGKSTVDKQTSGVK